MISAVRRDSASDYASRVGGLIGISIPSFWLATLLLLFTSRVFGWVPPLVYTSFFDDPLTNLSQFILPAISISVFTLAIVMRMVRATMLEVLSQDYVRTARAKGVTAPARDLPARAPERPDPGRHDRRLRDRHPDGRRRDRRDHLRPAGRRLRAAAGDLQPRLPARAGRDAADRNHLRRREHVVDIVYGWIDPRISQQ